MSIRNRLIMISVFVGILFAGAIVNDLTGMHALAVAMEVVGGAGSCFSALTLLIAL